MAKTIYTKERKTLSVLLIQARENANLSQRQVAETGILSQSELSKIETGQRKVEFLVLLKLAELYKKNITFFIPNNQSPK